MRLGDACKKIGSGSTPRGGKESYKDSGIPLIRSQNVLDFAFSNEGLAFIDDKQAQHLENVIVQKNDVLINITGDSVARACIAPDEYLPARVNQHVSIVRTDPLIADPHFVLYFLQQQKAHLLSIGSSGGTRNALTKRMLEELPLLMPDISTQRAIAATLSCLDAKIENNTKINHHLEQMAQAIFKSWFVDFEPWGGEMPDEWKEAEIGDVATLNAGGDKPAIFSPIPTDECAIPIFSNGIENFGLYGYTDRPKVTDESVTVSARGTIGYVCLRQEPFVPIVRLVTAIPNTEFITAKFLFLLLKNIHIAGVGTTQQQLTVPDFKKYRVLVPNLETVEDFTQIINPIFETIWHVRAENVRIAETRDVLLPRLMSGSLSVETRHALSLQNE